MQKMIRRGTAGLAAAMLAALAAPQGTGTVPIDLTIWGGHSTIELSGARETTTGLREVRLAILPTATTQYWIRYDNTLSLDNFTIAATGEETPAWFIGAQLAFAANSQTLFEAGMRDLPAGVRQHIFRAEHVMFDAPDGNSIKLGGWIGPRDDDVTEWLAYAAYGFKVSEKVRVEPHIFYSRSGIGNDDQYRVFVPAEFKLDNGMKLVVGASAGKASAPTGPETFIGGHAMLEAPIGQNTKGFLLVRHEQAGPELRLFNIALGITIGLR